MSKIVVDIDHIKEGLTDIGYLINDVIERNNNGFNWQIKFNNSGAIVTVYDTNRLNNSVVNGNADAAEKEQLKAIVDGLKTGSVCIDPLNKAIVDLINTHNESFYYDFKEELHIGEDLLHDILCMENNIENKESYLVYGISNSFKAIGIDGKITSNDILDFLKTIKFAGDNFPDLDFKKLYYKYHNIFVIVCKSSRKVPFYLVERYKGVNSNQIYTRVGDTNTPKNRHASYSDIEQLWKFHFFDNNSDNRR